MARLPQPGGDAGNWGDILNDYLAQTHKADGTLKDNTVTASVLAPNSVTNAALASDSVNAATIADGSITETLLESSVQTKLNAPTTIADDSVTRSKLAPAVRSELDAKLAEATASNLYAPRNLASFVTLGDSRTLLNGRAKEPASASGTIALENRGYVTQAMVMLRHRLRWIENGGVGGDTTAQMLARTDALLALNPGWLIGMGCINSVNQGVSAATIINELTQIFDKCLVKGVRVVWGTDWISGGTDTAEKKAVAASVNEWLRQQATSRPGFYLAEYAAIMSDATTGIPPASIAADQLHQDAPGAYLMARELERILAVLVPRSDRLIASNADTTNAIDNGMFVGSVSGIATGWSKGTSTAVHSKVARTDGIAGEWQQVVCTNETVSSLTRQITMSGTMFGPGDRVFAELEFETDAANWSATEFTVQLQYIGGAAGSSSNPKVVNDMMTAATSPLNLPRIENGIMRTPVLLIAAGATHLQMSVRFKGTGTYRVSRARIAKAA